MYYYIHVTNIWRDVYLGSFLFRPSLFEEIFLIELCFVLFDFLFKQWIMIINFNLFSKENDENRLLTKDEKVFFLFKRIHRSNTSRDIDKWKTSIHHVSWFIFVFQTILISFIYINLMFDFMVEVRYHYSKGMELGEKPLLLGA